MPNTADINTQEGEYVSALQATSLGGREEVVQILLDVGANVSARRGLFGSALQAASNGGYEKATTWSNSAQLRSCATLRLSLSLQRPFRTWR